MVQKRAANYKIANYCSKIYNIKKNEEKAWCKSDHGFKDTLKSGLQP